MKFSPFHFVYNNRTLVAANLYLKQMISNNSFMLTFIWSISYIFASAGNGCSVKYHKGLQRHLRKYRVEEPRRSTATNRGTASPYRHKRWLRECRPQWRQAGSTDNLQRWHHQHRRFYAGGKDRVRSNVLYKSRLPELCECKGFPGCGESVVNNEIIKYTTKSKDILNIGQFLSASKK